MYEHLSLFELNKLVQLTLTQSLAPAYWVVAEIAELRVNQSGHCYLELVQKEDERIIAKSRATIWSYTYRNLSLWFEKMAGESLKAGLKILCKINVQYHEVYGLSYNIKDIDAGYTLGERAKKRQAVIDKLMQEGIFERNKSLPIAPAISRLAIISSPVAAGYEDFINQLIHNSYGYEYATRLFKASMQGTNAAASIIGALHEIRNSSDRYDAVAVIRGGGSRLDLDCFDDYELNAHACRYTVPVITGIGHERDQSVLDMVVFKSLKTPTAVAEWIIGKSVEYETLLLQKMNVAAQLIEQKRKGEISRLERLEYRLRHGSEKMLAAHHNMMDKIVLKMTNGAEGIWDKNNQYLSLLETKIGLLNPENALIRGYTLTTKDGRPVTDDIKAGDVITTRTLSSIIESTVLSKNKR